MTSFFERQRAKLQGWLAGLRAGSPRRPKGYLPSFECLEDRCLLSVTVNEYLVLSNPAGLQAITRGLDNGLWFTESTANQIGRISTTGVVTEYAVPTANSKPTAITTGPDGAVWFTESNTNKIGRITTSGVFTEFVIPTSASDPEGITAGPDNALWFTESQGNKIGRLSLTGTFTEFSVPTSNSRPRGIVTGPDGALWFTESNASKIGRITTAGTFSEFVTPTGNSTPTGITSGPDGALWFTEFSNSANSIGRITTGGTVTEYNLPMNGSNPDGITVGPDGALWFTENDNAANNVGRISTGGVISEYAIPTTNSLPVGITQGPDGNLWFVESNSSKVGELIPDQPLTAAGKSIAATENTSFNGVVATFTDADAGAVAGDFTATIDWGDGTTSAGTVGGAGTFSVTGSHTYAAEGTFTVGVTIHDTAGRADNGGSSATCGGTATVADAPLTPAPSALAVFNTGVDNTGALLAAGAVDPHYQLVASADPINPGPNSYVVNPSQAPIPPWLADGPNSEWIAPQANQTTYVATGFFNYQTTFDLTGFDPSTAQLTGRFSSDNEVFDVLVNGQSTGINDGFTDTGQYKSWTSFTISSGFHAGLNTLVFHVHNDGGPTGLRVEMTGSASRVYTIAATEGTDSGLQAVAHFQDAGGAEAAANYSATINWGDGTTSAGTINPVAGGTFGVNGRHAYAHAGTYAVSASIADAGGASTVIQDTTFQVADAPLTATGTPVSAVEGAAFTAPVASFTDGNPLATASDFTATIAWGDGTTSAGTVTANAGGGFNVSGTHTYAEEGSNPIAVTITDVNGSAASTVTTATVADAQLTVAGNSVAAVEGNAFTGTVASFTDANPAAAVTDFTATITWGDGSTSAGTVTANQVGGFNVSGAHAYAEEGSYAVGVTVSDVGGGSASGLGSAAVADAALAATAAPVTAVEGTAFAGTVASFTDGNPGATAAEFTATITWGDGTTSAGTVAANKTGGFDVTGAHAYADEGSYTVAVAITDVGGSTASTQATATVADAPLAVGGSTVAAVEGNAFSGTVTAFTDGNAASTAADFSATISWGDGSTSAGTVTANTNGGFNVAGTHAYADEGSYSVSVTVTDVGGSTASAQSTATVADAPLAAAGTSVAAVEGNAFTGAVASFTDANPGAAPADFTASISWGDGTTSAGTITANTSGGFDVTGTHTYADEGNYAPSVSITDVGGSTAAAQARVAVADAPLTSAGTTFNAPQGDAFTAVVASFTDANPGAAVGDFTATIDWGNGTSTAGQVTANGNGTYNVTGTGSYAQNGSYSVKVTVKDVGGSTTTAQSTATVANLPLVSNGTTLAATEGSPFAGVVAFFTNAADPDDAANLYTVSIAWGDGTTSSGTVNGPAKVNGIWTGNYTVTGAHTYADEGTYAITVTITWLEGGNRVTAAGSTANVADAPLAVTARNIQPTEGGAFTGTVASFTDANPSATPAEFTASITWGDGITTAGTVTANQTGGFNVTGSHVYGDEGSYPVSVVVTDVGGITGSAQATAAVGDAPLQATGNAVSALEGNAFSGTVATFTDGNPGATATDFTPVISWGDGTTSAGTVTANQTGGFDVAGTHTYADEGSFPVAVTITDVGGSTASTQATATVADAPLVANSNPVVAQEGSAFSGVVASFTDGNPGSTAADFTAMITWGDGSTSAGTVTANKNGGFDVTGSYTYADEGSYPISVAITDVGGSTASAQTTAAVADAPLTATAKSVTAVEGNAFAGAVASFTDANPAATAADFTATVTWGDGSTSAGTVTANKNGGFDVTGSRTYADEGSYAVAVTITDLGGSTASVQGSAAVTDAPLAASFAPMSGVEGTAFTGTVASFTDGNPGATATDFTATITWGDGTTSAGTVTANTSGGFDVAGSHTYADEGSYAVAVTVTDAGGSTASAQGTAAVADAALAATGNPVAAVEGNRFSGTVASFTDGNPGASAADFTATITWGDGSTSAGAVTAKTGGGFDVTGSHTYADEGTYPVAVSVTDAGGATAFVQASATVVDAPLTASGNPVTATEGNLFSGTVASFTDANPGATAADFTATITWGDGSTSAGTVAANRNGGFDVTGSHTFADEGSCAVSVTVTDLGGSTASTQVTADVQDAPLTPSGNTVNATEGNSFSAVMVSFTDANPGATAADFTATISWGDGTSSAATVASNTNGGFDVLGSHTYADEGSYAVAVNIADLGGSTASVQAQATVADAPLLAAGKPVAAVEGNAFSGAVASFTDGNPMAAATDFAATVSWGDGTTSAGAIVANTSGGFDVMAAHTYADEGSYAVAVSITDQGGSSASAGASASVADAPLTAASSAVAAVEGLAWTGVVATFTDANPASTPAEFTAWIDWGDGSTSAGTVTANAAGGFDVAGTHTYAEEGTQTVTVSLADAGGSTASVAGTATIGDAPLRVAGSETVFTALTGSNTGTLVVATFTDPGADGTTADYKATIDWGDGSTSVGKVVRLTGNTFAVEGSHTYQSPGSYVLGALVSDAGGASATTSSGPVNANPPPVRLPEGIVLLESPDTATTETQAAHLADDPSDETNLLMAAKKASGPSRLLLVPEGDVLQPVAVQQPQAPPATQAAARHPAPPPAVSAARGPSLPAAVAGAVFGSPLQMGLLQDQLNALAQRVDDEIHYETVEAFIEAGVSLSASAGYVLWQTRNVYLLVGLLAATPLWRQMDPLTIVTLGKKKSKKRERREHDAEEEKALEALLASRSARDRDGRSPRG